MDINERLAKLETAVATIESSLTQFAILLGNIIDKQKLDLPKVSAPDFTKNNAIKMATHVTEPAKPVAEAPKPVATHIVEPVAEAPKPVAEEQLVVPKSIGDVPLELVNILNSKEWPHAVDPTLICDISSEQDKEDRAEGILDLIIDIHLENLRFLDFGCGEGHVVNRSKLQNPKIAVGYDINRHEKWDKWEKTPNMLLTDDWSAVRTAAPFNVVLMYDVIDHMNCTEQELVDRLKEIKGMLAPNGKVYVRLHPWCSRHGTHLYHQINKAFIHMVFTNEELKSLGYKQEETRKVMYPLSEYNAMFHKAGFKTQNGPHQIKEGVEPFFINNPKISQRIKSHYEPNPKSFLKSGSFPVAQLEQQFVDYVLT